MKKKILVCLMSVITIITMMPSAAFAGDDTQGNILTSNREEAKREFDIDDNLIFEAKSTTASGLNNELYDAATKAEKAGANKMAMVHVAKDISINTSVFVERNVVLVGETNREFSFAGEHSIYVGGAVYGGNYNGNGVSSNIFALRGMPNNKNGYIEKTTISHSKTNGIYATGASSGSHIINNNISDCGKNGIITGEGASIGILECNSIYDNTRRGILVQAGSNIKSMVDNEIYSNGYANISVVGASGKQTYVMADSNNSFYSSSKQGIEITKGGQMKILGANNVVEKNGGHGVELTSDAKFDVSGKLTIVPNSKKQWGLKFTNFCAVNLANTTIKGTYSVNYDSSCTFTRSNCTISGKISKVDYSIPKVQSFKATTTNCNTCTLTWKSTGVSGMKYQVYRSNSSSGSWGNPIATTTKTKYIDKSVIVGNKYYYKVRPYIEHESKRVYGSYTGVDSCYPHLDAISSFKAVASNSHATKLTWTKSANADAQIWVYRGTKPTGDWGNAHAKVKAGSKSFTEEYPKVKPGVKYYYKVREAVKGNDGKYHFGPYTSIDYAYPRVATPKNFEAYAPNKSCCKCVWDQIPGNNVKYLVYRGLKPTGDWGNAIAVLDKNQSSYIDKNVKAGRKYYYMVRAVETIQGQKFYSAYTKVDYGYPR